jgi:sugar transport protein
MQAIGFAGMAFGMLLLMIVVRPSNPPAGAGYIPLVFAGFILFNLLMNAGPNSITFTLALILFPTQLRGTASGFAAGVAKTGATLGVFVLPILKGSERPGSCGYHNLWSRGYRRLNRRRNRQPPRKCPISLWELFDRRSRRMAGCGIVR